MRNGKPKILLSSVTRPFGKRHGDAFSTSAQALYQQLWAQDVFRVEVPSYHWGLDVIAANIEAPTVVLHYPTLRELADELKNGYDYVGLSFNPPTLHKLRKMIPVIRKHAPDAKIILGGYGTAMRDDELEGLYDLICRGEGIAFFRELLGEEDKPFRNPVFVFKSALMSLPMMGRTAPLFGGVGCANGCDFCWTSYYFKKKHIRFLQTGDEMMDAIVAIKRADPKVGGFIVYDEDLLLNEKRGREFLAAVRESDERFSLSVFASVKALSKYEPTELAEMGLSMVWIGFEGMQAGYEKQVGKSYEELFRELKNVGISVAASMIIGFDYQTPEIIEREYAELMRLKPTVCQFLIYGPSRGTPLYERLDEEGRLGDVITHLPIMADGFTLAFDHPHISAPTMKNIARQLYEGEYEHLGSTAFRSIEVALMGYRALKDRPEPRLQIRAEIQKKLLRKAQAAKKAGIMFAPNNLVRARVEYLYDEIEREIGPPPGYIDVASNLVLAAGGWTKLKFAVQDAAQVSSRRYVYNFEEPRTLGTMGRSLRRKIAKIPRPFGPI